MISTFTMEAGLVIAALMAVVGVVQWKRQSGRQQQEKYILDYAGQVSELESQKREEERQQRQEEEKKQKDRLFGMDFMITHGSAFGGCAAICPDGRIRRDKVALDNILMYGKHPSGKEFTYYIEDQGLEICACDNPEELTVISKQQPFEIREAGLSRGQGVPTKQAVIKQDGFLLRTDGVRFQSPALNEVFSYKTDTAYLYFWSAMGIPEEQIDAKRIIIDNEVMTELNQELTAAGRDLAVKRFDTDSCGYTFHVEEGAVTLFSNTMVCPHCHNVLPQNFFKYEMLMIGLAGSVASGKTVYLCSLMMNGFDVMQRQNLTVRNAYGNPNDDYKIEMERNADRLMRYGICPESTSKAFKKPVFLEVTYRIGQKNLHMLTAIYDVAGELIRDSAGTGRTGFVRHMDGFICLVDPAQMHLEHSLINKQIPDEERVLEKLYVMGKEEQMSIQRMSNENGKQVMDQADFMMENTMSDEYFYERKADTVLDSIRSVLGDHELKQKYMALTIAKSDLLEELGEIKEYRGNSLLFERKQVSYGFMNMDHHFLRQEILKQIFDQKVFRLQRNLADYKESGLFAVSALGCETEETMEGTQKEVKTVGRVRPIRTEEPILWMMMKFMQERGWLE